MNIYYEEILDIYLHFYRFVYFYWVYCLCDPCNTTHIHYRTMARYDSYYMSHSVFKLAISASYWLIFFDISSLHGPRSRSKAFTSST